MRLHHSQGMHAYRDVGELQRAFMSLMRRSIPFMRHADTAAGAITNTINLSGPGAKSVNNPAVKKIVDKHLDKLEVLGFQLRLLKNMTSQLRTNFVGAPRSAAVLKSVETYTKQMEEELNKARRTAADNSRDVVSRSLVITNHSIMKTIEESMKKKYKTLAESYLIANVQAFKDKNTLVPAELGYVIVTDLMGTDGSAYPEFFIIIAIPKSANSKFWVATSTEFRTPQRVRWEAEAKNAVELRSIVADLMVQDGILGKAFPREIPVPKDAIKFGHPQVKSVKVNNNIIKVFVKNKKLIDTTRHELRVDLQSIIRASNPRNKDVIRDKVNKADGSIEFVFTLPNRLRGRMIPNSDLTQIKRLLNLNDAEVLRVKTALEDHE